MTYQFYLGTYEMVDHSIVAEVPMPDGSTKEFKVQPGERFLLRPHTKDRWIYAMRSEDGKETLMTQFCIERLLIDGHVKRILIPGDFDTGSVISCPHCGYNEDHTGYQYYPMDGVCRIW